MKNFLTNKSFHKTFFFSLFLIFIFFASCKNEGKTAKSNSESSSTVLDTLNKSSEELERLAKQLFEEGKSKESFLCSGIALRKSSNLKDSLTIMIRQVPILRQLNQFSKGDSLLGVADSLLNIYGKKNLLYAEFLYKKADQLRYRYDYKSAKIVIEEALEIHLDSLGEYSTAVLNDYNTLAICLEMESSFKESIDTYDKAMLIADSLHGKKSTDYLNPFYNKGLVYHKQGKIDSSILLMTEALNMRQSFLPPYHDHVISNIFSLGFMKNQKGDFLEAKTLFDSGLKSMEDHDRINQNHQANFLRGLGITYESVGNHEKAEDYYIRALDLYKELFGEESNNYKYFLNSLATTYIAQEKHQKAEDIILNILDTYDAQFGPENIETLFIKSNLANCYIRTGKHIKADSILEKICQAQLKQTSTDNVYYNDFLMLNGINKMKLKDYDKSIQLLEKVEHNRFKDLGAANSKTLHTQFQLANSKYTSGDTKQGLDLFENTIKNNIHNLLNNYTFLPESDYLNLIKNFEKNLTLLYKHIPSDSLSYFKKPIIDIVLNTKGISLNLNTIKNKIISENEDSGSELKQKIDKWRLLRNEYSKALTGSKVELKKLNELKYKIESIEFEINSGSQKKIIQQNNFIKVEDLKELLIKDEIYVDYVLLNNLKKDDRSLIYPIIIEKDENHKILPPIEVSKIKQIISKNESDYHNRDLANLLLNPILSASPSAKKINISPSGILNYVSFSALPYLDDFAINHFEIDVFFNAREFIGSNTDQKIKIVKASLFGGAKFNTNIKETQKAETIVAYEPNLDSHEEYINMRTSQTEKLSALPASRKEVLEIKNILSNNNVSVSLFVDNEMNETNLKKELNSNNSNIIHIATHGFYNSGESGNPYFKTFVFLSGANQNNINEIQNEDGIVNAYEIGTYNIDNCELFVLSTCLSTQGDLHNTQGIIGLPRALKNSGVKFVISTLYEIPDETTQEFMELFYSELITSKSPRESLTKTKQTFSTKYPNSIWAAFEII